MAEITKAEIDAKIAATMAASEKPADLKSIEPPEPEKPVTTMEVHKLVPDTVESPIPDEVLELLPSIDLESLLSLRLRRGWSTLECGQNRGHWLSPRKMKNLLLSPLSPMCLWLK